MSLHEYDSGRAAFKQKKPFSSDMHAAWQQGWFDAFDEAKDARFGPDPFIEQAIPDEWTDAVAQIQHK